MPAAKWRRWAAAVEPATQSPGNSISAVRLARRFLQPDEIRRLGRHHSINILRFAGHRSQREVDPRPRHYPREPWPRCADRFSTAPSMGVQDFKPESPGGRSTRIQPPRNDAAGHRIWRDARAGFTARLILDLIYGLPHSDAPESFARRGPLDTVLEMKPTGSPSSATRTYHGSSPPKNPGAATRHLPPPGPSCRCSRLVMRNLRQPTILLYRSMDHFARAQRRTGLWRSATSSSQQAIFQGQYSTRAGLGYLTRLACRSSLRFPEWTPYVGKNENETARNGRRRGCRPGSAAARVFPDRRGPHPAIFRRTPMADFCPRSVRKYARLQAEPRPASHGLVLPLLGSSFSFCQ